MSKPPSKSGGPGRGRNSGGSSRDGSSFGSSSSGGDRGRSPRSGGGSDGGGSRYNGGSRGDGPRGGGGSGGSQGGGSRYNGGSRGDSPRGDAPRGGGRGTYSREGAPREGGREGGRDSSYRSVGRDEAARGGGSRGGYTPRDGGGRSGAREDTPRSGGQRGTYSRDGGPRSDAPRGGPRDSFPRDGGSRGAPRDAAPRGSAPRDDAPRSSGPRDYSPRGTYSRDSAPRDGATRGGGRSDGPRATYSRGAPRDDRYGDKRENRYGGGGRSDGPRTGGRPIARPGPAPRAKAPTAKDPTLPAREGERIAKLLARAGVASRREVERMIIEGRVRLGDDLIETPSTVLTSLAGVTVDGNRVAAPECTRLFLFHKPSGLITAERDMAGRPTIYSALRNALPDGAGRVMPIGRLDLNTEGLLLLTNDGEFKRQLELPATGVPRTYRARTFGDITQSRLEELMEGIEVDGVIYGRIDANMERRTGRNQWIEMTLTEGKNREVRRVLEALDLQVSRLLRVSYGPFRLGDLPKGAAGEVSQKDLETFRRTLKENEAREANARAIDERKAAVAGDEDIGTTENIDTNKDIPTNEAEEAED